MELCTCLLLEIKARRISSASVPVEEVVGELRTPSRTAREAILELLQIRLK